MPQKPANSILLFSFFFLKKSCEKIVKFGTNLLEVRNTITQKKRKLVGPLKNKNNIPELKHHPNCQSKNKDIR